MLAETTAVFSIIGNVLDDRQISCRASGSYENISASGTQCACPRTPRPRQKLRVLRTKTEQAEVRCGGRPVTPEETSTASPRCDAVNWCYIR
jgi:hypothetical protein